MHLDDPKLSIEFVFVKNMQKPVLVWFEGRKPHWCNFLAWSMQGPRLLFSVFVIFWAVMHVIVGALILMYGHVLFSSFNNINKGWIFFYPLFFVFNLLEFQLKHWNIQNLLII